MREKPLMEDLFSLRKCDFHVSPFFGIADGLSCMETNLAQLKHYKNVHAGLRGIKPLHLCLTV